MVIFSDSTVVVLQTSKDILDNPKFHCNISEHMAESIAANVQLPLRTYVVYT